MKPFLREKKTFGFAEIPESTSFEAGYLVTVNAGWRSIRPVIETETCIGCGQCYLYCPDGVIVLKESGNALQTGWNVQHRFVFWK